SFRLLSMQHVCFDLVCISVSVFSIRVSLFVAFQNYSLLWIFAILTAFLKCKDIISFCVNNLLSFDLVLALFFNEFLRVRYSWCVSFLFFYKQVHHGQLHCLWQIKEESPGQHCTLSLSGS